MYRYKRNTTSLYARYIGYIIPYTQLSTDLWQQISIAAADIRSTVAKLKLYTLHAYTAGIILNNNAIRSGDVS